MVLTPCCPWFCNLCTESIVNHADSMKKTPAAAVTKGFPVLMQDIFQNLNEVMCEGGISKGEKRCAEPISDSLIPI